MRKLTSKLFLALLVFNILGSYGVFMGLALHNERKMVRALDDGLYDQAETIRLKLPITIPYAMDSREYSRVNGSFALNGSSYRLVKQALRMDTLHIVCVRDDKATLINKTLANIAETFSNNPTVPQGQTVSLTDFIKEYLSTSLAVVIDSFGWYRQVSNVSYNLMFISADKDSVIHPPERV